MVTINYSKYDNYFDDCQKNLIKSKLEAAIEEYNCYPIDFSVDDYSKTYTVSFVSAIGDNANYETTCITS